MIILKSLYKVPWWKHSKIRIYPSYQSLIATDLSCLNSYNRLIEHLNIFIINCLINMIYNILLFAKTITKRILIDFYINIMSTFYTVAGKSGMITCKADFCKAVFHIVDTSFDSDTLCGIFRMKDCIIYSFHFSNNTFLAAHRTDYKVVVRKS